MKMFNESLKQLLYGPIVNFQVPDILPKLLEKMCNNIGDAYLWECQIMGHGEEGITLNVDVIDLGEQDPSIWKQVAEELKAGITDEESSVQIEVSIHLYSHVGCQSTYDWKE